MTIAPSPGQGPSLSMRRSTCTLSGSIWRSFDSIKAWLGSTGQRWSAAVAPRLQICSIKACTTVSGGMVATAAQLAFGGGTLSTSMEGKFPANSAVRVIWRENSLRCAGLTEKQGWVELLVILDSSVEAARWAETKAVLMPLPGQNSTCTGIHFVALPAESLCNRFVHDCDKMQHVCY